MVPYFFKQSVWTKQVIDECLNENDKMLMMITVINYGSFLYYLVLYHFYNFSDLWIKVGIYNCYILVSAVVTCVIVIMKILFSKAEKKHNITRCFILKELRAHVEYHHKIAWHHVHVQLNYKAFSCNQSHC